MAMSLQSLCCQTISWNRNLFSHTLLAEISQPCLSLLVEHLSLFDLLSLDSFLRQNGIKTEMAIQELQKTFFNNVESYPIKATTCPHLLNLFQCDRSDWTLSRLIYRTLFVWMVEEHNVRRNEGLEDDAEAIWNTVLRKHPDLLRLFYPPFLRVSDEASLSILKLCQEKMKCSLKLAAQNIIYIIVDLKVYHFLMAPCFRTMLSELYGSLQVLSLSIKSSPELVDFVKHFRKNAKNLERICIFAIKNDDMDYFDEFLCVCSGVDGYNATAEGQKHKEMMRRALLHNSVEDTELLSASEVTDSQESNLGVQALSREDPDFDLMDDAVLFGTSATASKCHDNKGMQKADFKATNLVHSSIYVSILNHHLKSWFSLREFHLGVPELHPKICAGICNLLSRPQFKSFTLSSADFKVGEIEDILLAVALRKSSPLDKLMFVSLVNKWETLDAMMVQDTLSGKNAEEAEEFLKQFESRQMADCSEFQGTVQLEWYSCTFGLWTECLIRQYILKDRALTQLCLSDSICRLFMQSILRAMARTNLSLSQLIIEDWHILNQEDCQALVDLLLSLSQSLQSVSLSRCLVKKDLFSFSDVMEALSSCRMLTSLDLSSNELGDDIMPLILRLVQQTQLKELSLRRNKMSCIAIKDLLAQVSVLKNSKRGPFFSVLDLRDNLLNESDLMKDQNLIKDAVRTIIVNSVL